MDRASMTCSCPLIHPSGGGDQQESERIKAFRHDTSLSPVHGTDAFSDHTLAMNLASGVSDLQIS